MSTLPKLALTVSKDSFHEAFKSLSTDPVS